MDPRESKQERSESAKQATLLHELRVHQVELEAQNQELRRVQDELQEARSRYFDLYELAPVGYFSLSEVAIVLEANLTATSMLGLTKNSLLRSPLIRFVHRDDREAFLAHRKSLFDTGERQACELKMLRGADPIWVRLESTITRGADHAVLWRATVSDITERSRAEQRVRTSEARYRVMFENSRDALITLTPPTWQLTSGNGAALEMFRAVNATQLAELAFWDCAPEFQPDGRSSRAVACGMFEKAMRQGGHRFEWDYLSPLGGKATASVLLNPIELEGRSLLQATVRDESEAKSLQARMAQADRLATMGLISAGVAHEINNPLTYVTFNIERIARLVNRWRNAHVKVRSPLRKLREKAEAHVLPASEVERCARQALEGIHRIVTISRALGTFSRVEDPSLSLVSLNAAVDQAAIMAVNEIKFRARLKKELSTVPPLLGSEGKLAQVFLNLLINAAHSIEEGNTEGNLITIRTWAEAGYARAEVSDTGCGIAPENLDRIFDPFFTTKKAGVGSGLGLPICRSIVSGLGGSIEVHSELRVGSRFALAIPLAPQEATKSSEMSPMHASNVGAPRGRVLVVDDEPAIRSTLKSLLQGRHEVVTAASGAEARALLEADRNFDVVLCDLMMPQVSGMDLHAWLAQSDPLLADQVVFISGGAFTPKAVSYLASVSNLRIDKPFSTHRLTELVNARVNALRRTTARE